MDSFWDDEEKAAEPAPLATDTQNLSVEDQLKSLDEKEKKARKRRPGSFWKRPPTYVYADNFGFGVQSYQSMIDYLDEKDHGGKANRDQVHLPTLEERCMKKFDSRQPFKKYNNSEIDQYINKGENIREQIRQNDVLGVSNVLRRTHTNWSMTRKFVQLVKNSYVVDYRRLHGKEKAKEFEDFTYRAPTPLPVENHREVTPKPRYVDDLSAEFASVLGTLSQTRMEHEKELEMRREKMRMLDNKFEDVVNSMCERMERINHRADSIILQSPREMSVSRQQMQQMQKAQQLQQMQEYEQVQQMQQAQAMARMERDMGADITLRNRVKRDDDYQRMMECVNELTEMNSARNQLRMSLRNLDDELHGVGSRVADMAEQHYQDEMPVMDDSRLDMLRAQLASRRSESVVRSVAQLEDDRLEEEQEYVSCRKPKHAILFPKHTRITTRPKHPLLKDEVLSDVHARVLKKAGEIGSNTSECRRINSRARFINVFKPRPDTCDHDLIVEPSKLEMNIDFMAKTLAKRGSCQRRWDVDDEFERPVSNQNTNARLDYCELRARKPIEQHPSLSHRVRYATMRARSRVALFGY